MTLVQVSKELTPGLQLFPPSDPKETIAAPEVHAPAALPNNPPTPACTHRPFVSPLSVTLVPVKLVVA